jgi:hypothetical protein
MSNSEASPTDARRFVADELEGLPGLPLATAENVDRWYAEAERLHDALDQQNQSYPVPHELWHYLSDADIRAKEPGYRQRQDSFVTAYIAQLRTPRDLG